MTRLKELRGTELPALIPEFIAFVKDPSSTISIARNDKNIIGIMKALYSTVIMFKEKRFERRLQTRWMNEMPVKLFDRISEEALIPGYVMPRTFADTWDGFDESRIIGVYRVATRFDRHERREAIQAKWDVRRGARSLSTGTAQATAPARVGRL